MHVICGAPKPSQPEIDLEMHEIQTNDKPSQKEFEVNLAPSIGIGFVHVSLLTSVSLYKHTVYTFNKNIYNLLII